jgi:ABC-type uncharacterized transport system permease subunit
MLKAIRAKYGLRIIMTVVFECLNCFLVGCCWVAAAVAAQRVQSLQTG